jgi:succinate dehydrogenase flavin-adding protein (antitoxin of CptAB toxin-antitoxin module)
MKASDENLQSFFWETDLSKINIERNKQYIIERILELGDRDAVQWLFSKFSLAEVKTTLETSRRISKKSKNFWLIMLEDRPDV